MLSLKGTFNYLVTHSFGSGVCCYCKRICSKEIGETSWSFNWKPDISTLREIYLDIDIIERLKTFSFWSFAGFIYKHSQKNNVSLKAINPLEIGTVYKYHLESRLHNSRVLVYHGP